VSRRSLPEPSPIPETITNAALLPLVSRAVYAIVALGIPDLLTGGPRTSAILAKETGARPRLLHQLLRTVAATGLIRTEPGGGFTLTEDGSYLTENHPTASRDLVLTMGGRAIYAGMGAVTDVLRSDRTGIEITTGRTAFEWLAAHPDEAASFSRMMIAYHAGEPAAVAAACDFSGYGHIIDVGCGTGTLLAAVLAAAPQATGTLFELPHVIRAARTALADPVMASRCSFVEGDFRRGVPGGGDACLLSNILHDWDDETSVAILRRCRDALNPGGRLLVVEAVLPDSDAPHPAKIHDVLLAVCTNGSERTESEFTALFEPAGLELTRIIPTESAVSILELQPI
jgi:SAM-dependent methyltransferase